MRIASSSVHLEASATERTSVTITDRMETWGPARQPSEPPAVVDHHERGHLGASAESRDEEAVATSASLRRLLVERLLAHRRIETMKAPARHEHRVEGLEDTRGTRPTRPPWSGAGAELSHTETVVLERGYAFAARAEVTTTDGRALQVELAVGASTTEVLSSSASLQVGAPRAKDPLVLSTAGVSLDASRPVDFDLDGDGTSESVASLGGDAAFLAIDRDGSGSIDDGRELFGPTSGDGFSELQALDGDGNGWLDEADTAWTSLRLWRPGDAPTSLAEADVGAIAVRALDTPFELAGGTLRATSLYLKERGGAGVVQHVDLDV